jgi:hypothetical protein
MDNATIQRLKETISKSNNIGVVVGRDPSVDEMAATLSLYLLLKETKKKISVASPTDPIVELSSLVGINRVQRSLGGESSDLVVSFPYVEGEIEKVSYTLEEGSLNIIVKAAESGLSFDEKDVKYTHGSGSIDLLFVVGTPRLADIGDVFGAQKLSDIKIVNIDNKEENQGFGDIVLVSPQFSSVSEQVAEFAFSLGLRIDQDMAQNLLSGITTATKNFQDPRTTSLALEMAGLMMKRGATRVRSVAGGSERQNGQSATGPFTQQEPARQAPAARQEPAEQTQAPVRTQAPRPVAQPEPDSQEDDTPPVDWLAPKVYKGSSNF